jgi:hypothetical protein
LKKEEESWKRTKEEDAIKEFHELLERKRCGTKKKKKQQE